MVVVVAVLGWAVAAVVLLTGAAAVGATSVVTNPGLPGWACKHGLPPDMMALITSGCCSLDCPPTCKHGLPSNTTALITSGLW